LRSKHPETLSHDIREDSAKLIPDGPELIEPLEE